MVLYENEKFILERFSFDGENYICCVDKKTGEHLHGLFLDEELNQAIEYWNDEL